MFTPLILLLYPYTQRSFLCWHFISCILLISLILKGRARGREEELLVLYKWGASIHLCLSISLSIFVFFICQLISIYDMYGPTQFNPLPLICLRLQGHHLSLSGCFSLSEFCEDGKIVLLWPKRIEEMVMDSWTKWNSCQLHQRTCPG